MYANQKVNTGLHFLVLQKNLFKDITDAHFRQLKSVIRDVNLFDCLKTNTNGEELTKHRNKKKKESKLNLNPDKEPELCIREIHTLIWINFYHNHFSRFEWALTDKSPCFEIFLVICKNEQSATSMRTIRTTMQDNNARQQMFYVNRR